MNSSPVTSRHRINVKIKFQASFFKIMFQQLGGGGGVEVLGSAVCWIVFICAGTALPIYCCCVQPLSSMCDLCSYWCVVLEILKYICQTVSTDVLFILSVGSE
jgi:hypothetical protein